MGIEIEIVEWSGIHGEETHVSIGAPWLEQRDDFASRIDVGVLLGGFLGIGCATSTLDVGEDREGAGVLGAVAQCVEGGLSRTGVISASPEQLGEGRATAATLGLCRKDGAPFADRAAKLSGPGMDSGQPGSGWVEAILDIEQAAQPDQLVTNLIQGRVDLPGMEIVRIGGLEVPHLLGGDTQAKPGYHVERIDLQRSLEVLDGGILITALEVRLAHHPMGGEAGRVGLKGMRVGSQSEAEIAPIHGILCANNQFFQLHERPPCGCGAKRLSAADVPQRQATTSVPIR